MGDENAALADNNGIMAPPILQVEIKVFWPRRDVLMEIRYVTVCSRDYLKLGFRCTRRLEVRILWLIPRLVSFAHRWVYSMLHFKLTQNSRGRPSITSSPWHRFLAGFPKSNFTVRKKGPSWFYHITMFYVFYFSQLFSISSHKYSISYLISLRVSFFQSM